MKDNKNIVIGNERFQTKYTFTKSEKLNAPIKIAFTETSFIDYLYIFYIFIFKCLVIKILYYLVVININLL